MIVRFYHSIEIRTIISLSNITQKDGGDTVKAFRNNKNNSYYINIYSNAVVSLKLMPNIYFVALLNHEQF